MSARVTRLRALPSVESVLEQPVLAGAGSELPRTLLVESVRAEIAALRAALSGGDGAKAGSPDPAPLAERALARARAAHRPSLTRVLNATGVILHTNLGRAPLSETARRAVDEAARGYVNLEYDLASGRRGQRGEGVERWLTRLTGAEAALVVNNGAGAILLALSALASGRRVLVSRGELVEIGGSFRIPDVIEKGGCRLLEVGTTNRTHLADYRRAIERHRAEIGAVLRVHPSNFRVSGFTARPDLVELATLAHRARLPLIEDLGSGALVDLGELGLEPEPTVRESLNAGVDVVTFSGDKLLGATQAGLLLGRRTYVQRARKDPLARALRVDKLTLAALEATLMAYGDPARARHELPALRMLHTAPEALERRARMLAEALRRQAPDFEVGIERGEGEVGGGALPLQRLPGWVVTLVHAGLTPDDIDRRARAADPPVIGTIRAGKYRLDVRTLTDAEAVEAAEALARAQL
jgi:L-seryl-tRNA(Ser) seleniumtransferase